MENDRLNLIELINRFKEEVEHIKDSYLEDKHTLEKVNNISIQLKEIEKVLKPKQKDLREKIKTLEEILHELVQIKFYVMLDQVDEIFKNIDKNLLDGMYLSKIEGSNERLIVFEDKEVGKIKILEEYKPQIKILVSVYDKSEKFEVNDSIRIFNIISFINNSFNYK